MFKMRLTHKIKPGDVTNLSDQDSRVIFEKRTVAVEDIVEILSPSGRFLAQVIEISRASTTLQIVSRVEGEDVETIGSITAIQAILPKKRFSYFIEKGTELGVDRFIPIESSYSKLDLKSFNRELAYYKELIRESCEQCNRIDTPELSTPIDISQLNNLLPTDTNQCRIALATEALNSRSLTEMFNHKDKSELRRVNFVIAIGPESGWHPRDLKVLERLGFSFAKLNGNILRAETAAIPIISVIHYLRGDQ